MNRINEQPETLPLGLDARPRGQCYVCGSSASNRRIILDPARPLNPGRVVLMCVAHQAVCRTHLLDPCPECDAR